ncbi:MULTISPECIES: hypothetical protein [unclassified Variovorax]|uniref:hypothetical protein n=1 Tax=unclassified Variovorax TaxID=663243 RepID=UPI003F473FFA
MRSAGRAAVLWALALGGCTALDAHSFDHSAGWRAAQVVAVGRAADLAGTVDRDCGSPGDGTAPYAVVRYRNGGVHTRSLGTGRLPAGAVPAVGDAVHVNILDCAAPLVVQSGSSSGTPSR